MRSVRIHCLLLSDNEQLGDHIQQLLSEVEDLRYSLERVPVPEASSTLEMNRFDIMLGELEDQDSDWVRECRTLYPHLPIVVMTKTLDHKLGLWAIREGAHDYICQQGLSADTLLRTLRYSQERSRVDSTLRLSQEQLFQTQKMEAIGRTVSGLAHQFRQSVQIILSNCSTLRVIHNEDDTTQDLTLEIKSAAQDANKLVEQVFSFAQSARSKAKCSLNQAILEHELMLNSIAGDVQFEMDLCPLSPAVNMPKSELGQLLLNLVSNSVDACSQGGWVKVRTRILQLEHEYLGGGLQLRPGGYAVLSVADNGSGIKPEVGKRILEPFFTTKTKGRGTGLGLPTVFNLCRRYQVSLDYQSQQGMGTVFRLVFPIGGAAQMTHEALELDNTLLVWSGDTGEQLTMRRQLESAVNRVLEVTSWRDLKQIIDIFPDAILLVDGVTFWKEVAQKSLQGELPRTLVVSEWPANFDPTTEDLTRLPSPFSQAELAEAVQSLSTQAVH